MSRCVLILIFLLLLGHIHIINATQLLHDNFVEYYVTNFTDNKVMAYQKPLYKNELTVDRILKWETAYKKKERNLFSWLNKEVMMKNSWEYYKKTFISDDGRVIDHQRASVTTSEGQAYAMRRALIMRDKITFDKLYNWSRYNLDRKSDHLFAWLWGQKIHPREGKIEYGIIDPNSASDADIEIATDLIFAYKIWGNQQYMVDARKILNDIWNLETIEIKGERILTSGFNQRHASENVEINPSYFMPYIFTIFAQIDKKHDWNKLTDSSYRLVNFCIDHIKSGLPPDVFYMNKNTGDIIFDKDKSDFSYDAIRTFYRFYIAYILTKDKRSEKLLLKSKMFIKRWKEEKKFYTSYKQDGTPKDYTEAIGSIALMLPVIKTYDKKVAKEIYEQRIKRKYNNKGYWNDPLDYYAQNLVWFGSWLYQDDENVKLFKY